MSAIDLHSTQTTPSALSPSSLRVELFATNLHTPTHMEWTADGRLLAAEHTAGRVVDITDGGDLRDAKPFATGLQGPTSILPLPDGRILVSEMWSGRIADITDGGDVSDREPFAEGLRGPYSLSRIGGSSTSSSIRRRARRKSRKFEVATTSSRLSPMFQECHSMARRD